jgi:drug/metabolite transporter (DMT)-like permease
MSKPSTHDDSARGFALGLLGVVVFAMTLPMTRLAVGDASAPQLPPAFVTAARAGLAGLLSIAYLRWIGAVRPAREHWPALTVCALGTVLGFPLFLAWALRDVDAMHAAVVTGVLPLGTAVAAALWLRQRASRGFWLCALIGCVLVSAFAAQRGAGALVAADGLLLLAVACASIGYVAGAQVSARLPAEQVICWVLVLSLPLTLPATLAAWPADAAAGARERLDRSWPTLRFSRCGSASSPGTAAWHSAACCVSARCNCSSPSWRCCSRCRCSASASTPSPWPSRSR